MRKRSCEEINVNRARIIGQSVAEVGNEFLSAVGTGLEDGTKQISPRGGWVSTKIVFGAGNQSAAELPAADAIRGASTGGIERIKRHSLRGHGAACGAKDVAIGIEQRHVGFKRDPIKIPQAAVRSDEQWAGEADRLRVKLPVFPDVCQRARPISEIGQPIKISIVIRTAAHLDEGRSRQEWPAGREAEAVVGVQTGHAVLFARDQAVQGDGIGKITKLKVAKLIRESGIVRAP